MKISQLSPDTAILKELGKRLRQIRKQQGYSQDRLASEAGLGVATLRRIEDGHDSQLGSWLKILKTLQMTASIDALLPENFNSPMAEVLAQKKRSSNKPLNPTASTRVTWGDEEA